MDAPEKILCTRVNFPPGSSRWVEGLPQIFSVGIVVGSTGSGKAKALSQLKTAGVVHKTLGATSVKSSWPVDRAIISVIAERWQGNEAAIERLSAVGMNSVTDWKKTHRALSNGQRARAEVAAELSSGTAINHFGATVDSVEARCFAAGVAKLVHRQCLERVVLATGRQAAEVSSWAGADWVFFVSSGVLCLRGGGAAGGNTRAEVTVELDNSTTDEAVARARPRTRRRHPGETASQTQRSSFSGTGPPTLLTSTTLKDAATEAADAVFDTESSGETTFTLPRLPNLPRLWEVGLIMGPSGTGKSGIQAQLCSPPGSAAEAVGRGNNPIVAWAAAAKLETSTSATALETLCSGLAANGLRDEGASAALRAVGGRHLEEAAGARPWALLSEGERHLVHVAEVALHATAAPTKSEGGGGSGQVVEPPIPIDEFTSLNDRGSAQRCAMGLAAVLRGTGGGDRRRAVARKVVVATVHPDVEAWLKPDWVFNTAKGTLTVLTWSSPELPTGVPIVRPVAASSSASSSAVVELFAEAPPCLETMRALFERPLVRVVVRPTHRVGESRAHQLALWDEFKPHHYRSSNLNNAARTYAARFVDGAGEESDTVAFVAVVPQPGKRAQNDARTIFRESRIVVRPEMQGLGIGPRVSDCVANQFLCEGYRFTSKTAHPRFGGYRDRSELWKAMPGNGLPDDSVSTHNAEQRKALCAKHKVASETEAKKLEKAASARSSGVQRLYFKHEFLGDSKAKGITLEHRKRTQGEGAGMHLYFGSTPAHSSSTPLLGPDASPPSATQHRSILGAAGEASALLLHSRSAQHTPPPVVPTTSSRTGPPKQQSKLHFGAATAASGGGSSHSSSLFGRDIPGASKRKAPVPWAFPPLRPSAAQPSSAPKQARTTKAQPPAIGRAPVSKTEPPPAAVYIVLDSDSETE